jgi:AcrR family transcriptional regulator
MSQRPLRADARRNRDRVLAVAYETFATEGLAVPVHEIARRAGVGTGTVSRHFPTKEALFEAILRSRVELLAARARELTGAADPGAAFAELFGALVEEAAANRGLSDALAGAGFDLDTIVSAGDGLFAGLAELLGRAQRSGAIRSDVDIADVKALLVGCLSHRDGADPAVRARIVAVACAGLRADPSV